MIQTLEGTSYAVYQVFDAIRADPRHADVRIVERRYVDERSFATWSMGFRNVSAREVADLQDFNEFARQSVGHDLVAHAASALDLLKTFRVNTALRWAGSRAGPMRSCVPAPPRLVPERE